MSAKDTWPPEVCPPWCCREHRPQDHPEDRIHEAAPIVLAAEGRASLLPEHLPEVIELHVQVRQPFSDPAPWVELRTDPSRGHAINLSVATVRQLAARLSEVTRMG